MKAYSCCLLGPQSFLACAQEHLERVQDESSAAEEHEKKLSGDAIKLSVLSSFTLQESSQCRTFPWEPEDCQHWSLQSMSLEAWWMEEETFRLLTARDHSSISIPLWLLWCFFSCFPERPQNAEDWPVLGRGRIKSSHMRGTNSTCKTTFEYMTNRAHLFCQTNVWCCVCEF